MVYATVWANKAFASASLGGRIKTNVFLSSARPHSPLKTQTTQSFPRIARRVSIHQHTRTRNARACERMLATGGEPRARKSGICISRREPLLEGVAQFLIFFRRAVFGILVSWGICFVSFNPIFILFSPHFSSYCAFFFLFIVGTRLIRIFNGALPPNNRGIQMDMAVNDV